MKRLAANEIVRLAAAPLRKGVTVDLSGLEIVEPLDLSGALLGHLDFSGSRFCAPVMFRDARFQGLAWFKGCRFEAAFDASRAVFCNDLRMKCATFEGPVALSRAELHGILELDEARFSDRVDLDHLLAFANASMADTQFLAPVTFQGSELLGGLWCEGARFTRRADFRDLNVHGRTWLQNMQLPGRDTIAGQTSTRDIRSHGYRWQ